MEASIQTLLEQRSKARIDRDWAEADRLRKLIEAQGYQVVDRKDGTSELKGCEVEKRELSEMPVVRQEKNHSQYLDEDGKLWSYDRYSWSETEKRLIIACRINDLDGMMRKS